jgi:hypothetical protein
MFLSSAADQMRLMRLADELEQEANDLEYRDNEGIRSIFASSQTAKFVAALSDAARQTDSRSDGTFRPPKVYVAFSYAVGRYDSILTKHGINTGLGSFLVLQALLTVRFGISMSPPANLVKGSK